MIPSPVSERPLSAAALFRLHVIARASALSAGLLCAALPAHAAQDTVVVTASRSPERASAAVAEVSVIDRATLDRSAGRTLVEILAQLPGLQFSANGGLGKSASVFIRGLEARHTLLLLDGVRIGSATLGTPSLDNLPLDTVERIEVVRGPMSALYGSDAVGGVIQIFTARGKPGLQPVARISAGSDRYGQASAGIGYGQGGFDASLQVQHTETRGFSATNSKVQFGQYNPDRDGFRQDGGSLRLGWQFAPDWRVEALAVESNGRTGYDDGPGTDAQAGLHNSLRLLQLSGRPMADWHSQLSLSRATDAYDTLSSASIYATLGAIETRQTQLSWENRIATPIGTALVLVERLAQQVSRPNQPFALSDRTINGLALGLNGQAAGHSWQAALRRDQNSQFGGQSTGALGYAYQLAPAWRAGLSYGTSFVAPSFNQLYYPGFGNPLLQPETGRQTEAHLRWAEGAHSVRATVYENRIRGYISSGPAPTNIPRTRIPGVTVAYEGQWNALKLGASLDHLNPRNDTAGSANFDKLLPRRAQNMAKAQADWTSGAWVLGASLSGYSERFDDPANSLRLAGYATLDLRADWAVAPDWTLGARVNNVANRVYETAYGYNQALRQGFLTLRYQPR
jgi:vitamin B12 transporter